MINTNLDLTLLDNPEIESLGTINSHSDHKIFINGKEPVLSLNGNWKFKFFNSFTNDVLYYLNPNISIKDFKDINVPGHFELQGYGKPQYVNQCYPWFGVEDVPLGKSPKINPLGIYFKDLNFEKEINSRIVLSFDGFETAIFVYVNGFFVGYSEKNFVTSEFDITKYLIKGINRIAVVCFKYAKSSWFLDQDMWRFGGIFRDVKIKLVPLTNVFDIDNKTILKEDLKTGLLDLKITFEGDLTNCDVIYSLAYADNKLFEEKTKITNSLIEIKKDISNVLPWSAELPHLYVFTLTLLKDNKEVLTTQINVGFRRIEIVDNKILINSKKLILKGINRHEFEAHKGRAISKEDIIDDIKIIKSHNINAIRTSHYPNQQELYELCDIYGLYLCDEVALETHGTWGSPFKLHNIKDVLPGNHMEFKDFIISKTKGMYERDKNHPSIIMWSLGNESYGGKVLEASRDYLKNVDNTRFIQYEGVFHYRKSDFISDVESQMYTSPANVAKFISKHPKKPFILCEFEHAMGNSLGNFDEYMDLFNKYESYHGGFIWDYMDQGLYSKERDTYLYGGDFDDRPNDSTFCCNGVLLANKTSFAKIDTVKYYYQDIKFKKVKDGILFKNTNLFKTSESYYFKICLFENGALANEENFSLNLLPGGEFLFNLKDFKVDREKEILIRISYHLKQDEFYAPKDYELGFFEQLLTSSLENGMVNPILKTDNKLEIIKNDFNLGIKGNGFNYIFTNFAQMNGGLKSIKINGTEFIYDFPKLSLFRPTTDNDDPIARNFLSRYFAYSRYQTNFPFLGDFKVGKYNGESIKITYKYRILDSLRTRSYKLTYEVFNSGDIKVDLSYHKRVGEPGIGEFGLAFSVPTKDVKFSYYGLGENDNYPDRYEGEKLGVMLAVQIMNM